MIQQHLLAEVWTGAVVEISALQRCIGLLRNALGGVGFKYTELIVNSFFGKKHEFFEQPTRGFSVLSSTSFR